MELQTKAEQTLVPAVGRRCRRRRCQMRVHISDWREPGSPGSRPHNGFHSGHGPIEIIVVYSSGGNFQMTSKPLSGGDATATVTVTTSRCAADEEIGQR
jgi:hypothetical protein